MSGPVLWEVGDHYVRQRDDGLYEVITGDIIAGPFPTITFALQIASNEKPAPVMSRKFHRFRIIREVAHVT